MNEERRTRPVDDDAIEFVTRIRSRSVSCRWVAGQVWGDPELIERVQRSAGALQWQSTPAAVARAISSAVASPVTIRVLSKPVG